MRISDWRSDVCSSDLYSPGVEKGLKSAWATGVLVGFPVVDVKVTLIDGAYHDVDSSVLAFEIAARAAFKEGMEKAKPLLLEPVMRVECVTPDEYMGDIIGDLNRTEEHTSELQSPMRISYDVFCLK